MLARMSVEKVAATIRRGIKKLTELVDERADPDCEDCFGSGYDTEQRCHCLRPVR